MQTDTFDPAFTELAVHRGAVYLDVIQQVARLVRAERYLEIGTEAGFSLVRVDCASVAIDPQFQLQVDVVGKKPACHLFQMTSDDFFARHNPTTLLGGSLDLAMLDGMHLYEFLLRDFMNTERHCSRDALILLHDCLPPVAEMTSRSRRNTSRNPKYPNAWTGDVWKTVLALQRYRPDLRLIYLDAPPTGLVVCANLDPHSTVLSDRYADIVKELAPRGDDIDLLRSFMASITLQSTARLADRRSWKDLLAGR